MTAEQPEGGVEAYVLRAMIELTMSPSFSLSALQAFRFEQFACVITSSMSCITHTQSLAQVWNSALPQMGRYGCVTFCSNPLSSTSPSSSSSSSSSALPPSIPAAALGPGALSSPAALEAAFCCSCCASCCAADAWACELRSSILASPKMLW